MSYSKRVGLAAMPGAGVTVVGPSRGLGDFWSDLLQGFLASPATQDAQAAAVTKYGPTVANSALSAWVTKYQVPLVLGGLGLTLVLARGRR